jgi:hypothetical protein
MTHLKIKLQTLETLIYNHSSKIYNINTTVDNNESKIYLDKLVNNSINTINRRQTTLKSSNNYWNCFLLSKFK